MCGPPPPASQVLIGFLDVSDGFVMKVVSKKIKCYKKFMW